MQYIYAAMLLHASGKPVTEDGMKKVLTGAGVEPDEGRIKSIVVSLEGKDIDEIIASGVPFAPAGAPAPPGPAKGGGEQEPSKKGEPSKKKDVEKPSEEDAAAGLGALFG